MQLSSCIIKWQMKFGVGKDKIFHMAKVNFKVIYEMITAEMFFSSQKQYLWGDTFMGLSIASGQYLVANQKK